MQRRFHTSTTALSIWASCRSHFAARASRGVSRHDLCSSGTSFDLIDEASSFDTKIDLSQVICPILHRTDARMVLTMELLQAQRQNRQKLRGSEWHSPTNDHAAASTLPIPFDTIASHDILRVHCLTNCMVHSIPLIFFIQLCNAAGT
jgi:hypothetical protein